MPSRGWKILATIIFWLYYSAPGIAAAEELIGTFGNWKINYVTSNKAYEIVGSSTGKSGGTFDLQCHAAPAGRVYTLMVPLWNLVGQSQPATKKVLIWSDNHRPEELLFRLVNGFLALAISSDDASRSNVERFVEILGQTGHLFSFSYDVTTVEFDATHLPAARSKFFEVCNYGARP